MFLLSSTLCSLQINMIFVNKHSKMGVSGLPAIPLVLRTDFCTRILRSIAVTPDQATTTSPEGRLTTVWLTSYAHPFKILRQHPKLFLKALRKVRWRTEPDQIGNFTHAVFLLTQQPGCLFQSYQPDEIIGCQF